MEKNKTNKIQVKKILGNYIKVGEPLTVYNNKLLNSLVDQICELTADEKVLKGKEWCLHLTIIILKHKPKC